MRRCQYNSKAHIDVAIGVAAFVCVGGWVCRWIRCQEAAYTLWTHTNKH
jgi:hypothetical protein